MSCGNSLVVQLLISLAVCLSMICILSEAYVLPVDYMHTMQGTDTADLGTQFSILHGLQTSWLKKGAPESELPFFPVDQQNQITFEGSNTAESDFPYFGGFIQLSFHSDFSELFDEFLDIWKFSGQSYQSGGFSKQPDFFQDSEAQNVIAELLGIPEEYTTIPNKGFVLARYWKVVRVQEIKNPSATSSAIEQELQMAENENDVIELFAKYGTHFLSGYTEGDCIYQVFVYDHEVYNDVMEQYPQTELYLFGALGFNFRLFTKPRYSAPDTDHIFGYSEYVGKILALSQDPSFENIRPYLADDLYDVQESIFKFVTDISVTSMTNSMTTTIKLKLKFDAIFNYAITDSTLQRYWNDTLMASTFQKFGNDSSPDFQNVSAESFSSYMQTFNPDIVTSTATSYSAIIQMNFNLRDLTILNPEFVTNLFIFADVIEIFPGTPITLPGQTSIHIICRKFISHSDSDEVPEITVLANNVVLVAFDFVGVLRIVNDKTTQHFTIVNGTKFETVSDTNFANLYTVSSTYIPKLPTPSALPELYSQDTSSYYNVWLSRNFINALQLEMVSVQSILSIRANDDTVKEGESALLWIIEILSDANVDQLSLELETVLGQALLISTTRQPEYVKATLLVPRLTYSQYKVLYEEMLDLIESYENQLMQVSAEISSRKQAEIVANTQMQLNENILSIGNFLIGQVQAATAYQQDIADYHDSIDSMKRDQIEIAEDEAKDLLDELEEQQEEVKNAGEALKAALEQYQAEQIVREVFEVVGVVGSLFSGGLGLQALPATAANIEKVAKKLNM